MSQEITSIAATVRFLQEENQRLVQLTQELEEENAFLRESFKSIRGLQRALARLDARLELQSLLDRIIYEALRIVDAADGSLSLIDVDRQEVVFIVVRGALHDKLQGYRIPMGEGIVGWVCQHGEPVIANDIAQDERFSPAIDIQFQFQTHSLICAPMISRGQVLGAIEVVNKFSARPFDDKDIEMLSMVALVASAAIDLANTEPLAREPEAM
jgi:sigma-B regulation protein RsbU (phosphoserine phosphatase)